MGRDEKKLESVAKELKGNTLVAAGDVTKEEDVKAIFEKAIAKFGTVDVVLNAAGISNYGAIGEMNPSQWWAEHVSLFDDFLHMRTTPRLNLYIVKF